MPDWADVYVPSFAERSALARRALFFVLNAAERLEDEGIRQADVMLRAQSLKRSGGRAAQEAAGRGAIENVFACKPVRRESAVGFITSVNNLLADHKVAWRFTTRDIIACVFRLKDGPEIAAALGVSPADIARHTGIKLSIVECAVQRWRITYAHAEAIRQYLLQIKADKKANDPILSALSADPMGLIKTDSRSDLPMAVKQIEIDPGRFEFVYGWEDLSAAPPAGHPWAIETADQSQRRRRGS